MDFSFLQSQDVAVGEFVVNLLVAFALSWGLARIYRRFGRSLSERESFAANFVPLTLTTAIIISILQTNIVLSLGLVGALSIIRFRTAIKEPEELTYVFFCVAIGLGLGAGQRALSLVGFVVVAGVLSLRGWRQGPVIRQQLLTVAGPSRVDPQQVVEAVQSQSTFVDLKRLEEGDGRFETVLVVELESPDALGDLRRGLREIDEELAWTLMDHRHFA